MAKELRKKIFNGQANAQEKGCFEFKMAWGSAPHHEKVWKGGEDALYVSKNILVVADGVGGWAKMGIDSGTYARQLITEIKQLLDSDKLLYYIQRPEQLAIRCVQKNNQKGSSTLSIITLHPHTGMLRSYHIGDSVYALYKLSGQFFMAREQQRSFNVPFQVYGGANNVLQGDVDSDDSDAQSPVSDVFKGSYNQFSCNELEDSLILIASDGLWDNLSSQDIHDTLYKEEGSLVDKVKLLTRKAKQNAILPQFQSPFYLKGTKQGQKVPKGGKIDDITIILVMICLNN